MAASSSSSGNVSNDLDGYPFDPSALYDFFEPMFFEPIMSWEHYYMINVLRAERNLREIVRS